MWLKIVYDEDDIAYWPERPEKISVFLESSLEVIIPASGKTFRVSPIFPLNLKMVNIKVDNTKILFFNLPNPYCALGRIDKKGSQELKDSTFFSLGLSSVILISSKDFLASELKKIVAQKVNAYEEWTITNGKIGNIRYEIENQKTPFDYPDILTNYSQLEVTERAIVDEFRINIKLLLLKLTFHMPSEQLKIKKLVEDIDLLVKELVYLKTQKGDLPSTLNEYSSEELLDKKLTNLIWHQNIDRIIQINSALSYVSTQAFSGAIPILERRSLIRRNSLLGIGSAILALNRLTRFIENAFSVVGFEKIITEYMSISTPLEGITELQNYTSNTWYKNSIDTFAEKAKDELSHSKLPYFSGRLGFRETEYSIAAALQCITSGASLEWSLMTLTHELLHGHVRKIISSIFYGEGDKKPEIQKNIFYQRFKEKVLRKIDNGKQIDSIRNLILSYCALARTHGSITVSIPYKSELDIKLPSEDGIWNILESENRNISEIFVHVLDLHYFYASRVSVYIPLIWCSWLSVPHISGDKRQYILRSILTIASTCKGSKIQRFKTSVVSLKKLLQYHQKGKLSSPIIEEVVKILENDTLLNNEYFHAFRVSLCIVDLVKEVFFSSKVRSALFKDILVQWKKDEQDEEESEDKFVYNLPDGFNDEKIEAPLSYLLDRMIKELNSVGGIQDLERESTTQFLALNSFE